MGVSLTGNRDRGDDNKHSGLIVLYTQPHSQTFFRFFFSDIFLWQWVWTECKYLLSNWCLFHLAWFERTMMEICYWYCRLFCYLYNALECAVLMMSSFLPSQRRWTLGTNEPRHDKTNKMSVRPAKTQISLGICLVWSESSLSAWRNLGSLATYWAHSEDSDQTGWMPRLIWVFAGRTLILLVLSCRGSNAVLCVFNTIVVECIFAVWSFTDFNSYEHKFASVVSVWILSMLLHKRIVGENGVSCNRQYLTPCFHVLTKQTFYDFLKNCIFRKLTTDFENIQNVKLRPKLASCRALTTRPYPSELVKSILQPEISTDFAHFRFKCKIFKFQ